MTEFDLEPVYPIILTQASDGRDQLLNKYRETFGNTLDPSFDHNLGHTVELHYLGRHTVG